MKAEVLTESLAVDIATILKMAERLQGWAEDSLIKARTETDLRRENMHMNSYRSYLDTAAQLKKAVKKCLTP